MSRVDKKMNRQEKYIQVRIGQLHEDMNKAKDEHDKAWYKRLIQELDWAEQMLSKPSHNCYMEKPYNVTITSYNGKRID